MTAAEIKAKAIRGAERELARAREAHGARWPDVAEWVEAHIVTSAKIWALEMSHRPAQ